MSENIDDLESPRQQYSVVAAAAHTECGLLANRVSLDPMARVMFAWRSVSPKKDSMRMNDAAVYGLLGDTILIIHIAFVVFVVFGFLLILIGMSA